MPAILLAAQAVVTHGGAAALPGDRGPLPLARMLAAPHAAAPPPPDATAAVPAGIATAMARTAVVRCRRRGMRLGVAVVDAAGVLRAAASADGATPGAVFVAARKAATAAAFGVPTAVVQARLRLDPAAYRIAPYMAVSPGAIPLLRHGRPVGAIGASGGTGDWDETCVRAAARAVPDREIDR